MFHQISWVRIRDWHILTNGLVRFTTDDRFNVLYKEGSFNWILQVSNNSPPPHKGRTFLANFRGGRKRGGNILRREIFPYSGSPGKPELSQMQQMLEMCSMQGHHFFRPTVSFSLFYASFAHIFLFYAFYLFTPECRQFPLSYLARPLGAVKTKQKSQ